MRFNNETEIRNNLIYQLTPYLGVLKDYGADYLGYRYFKNDGSSFGFTTNDKWYAKKKTAKFFEAQRKHLECELRTLIINKLSYVTRSREQTENEYMKLLEERGMSNSVGIYRFSLTKAEHFFFISSSHEPFFRDKILNHLNDLEVLVNRLSPLIDKAFTEAKVKPSPEFFLSKEAIEFIFENHNEHLKPGQGVRIKVNDEKKNFTPRECEVLAWLSFAISNRSIAYKLHISPRTVEKFIDNLKYKFDCNRKELVKIAKQKKWQSIFKLQFNLKENNQ